MDTFENENTRHKTHFKAFALNDGEGTKGMLDSCG